MNNHLAAVAILNTYLRQDPDLLDGHTDPTKVVPHWFYNRFKQEKFKEPRPQYNGPVRPGVIERLKAWERDPIFDLSNPPREEEWTDEELWAFHNYETAVKQWGREKYRWELAQDLIMLRRWIHWLTQFTRLSLFDEQVMQFAELIPPDEEYPFPPDEEYPFMPDEE